MELKRCIAFLSWKILFPYLLAEEVANICHTPKVTVWHHACDAEQRRKHMNEEMTVNGKSYTIIKLLGKGKGGYSYLAESGNNRYVITLSEGFRARDLIRSDRSS